MIENNAGEGEQKLHKCFRKDNGPMTVILFFLKTDTEVDKTRGAGNLIQYFTTSAENAPPLRRRRLGPYSYL